MLAALLATALAGPPDVSWCRAGSDGADGWSWLTPQDRLVDADLYLQCTMVTARQVEERKDRSGPHAMRTISLWTNALATEALRAGSTVWPDGAAVVKLKAAPRASFDPAASGDAPAEGSLGLMWREGDAWRYGWRAATNAPLIELPRANVCSSCHEPAAPRSIPAGTRGWNEPTNGLFLPWARDDGGRLDATAVLAQVQMATTAPAADRDQSPNTTQEPAGDAARGQSPNTAQDRAGDAGRTEAAAAASTAANVAWWHEARLGMFVHWGLYSVAAGQWDGKDIPGWGEWLLNKIKVDPAVYASTLMPRFDPVKFDADAWVRAAKDAGMGYIVVTTKHHDGFLLWDSATTDLDLMGTPFGKAGRDPLRELAQACQRHGIRLGLYFSLMDWSDRDYLPRREWDTRTTDGASMPRFVDRMHAQVKELTDGRFGPVAILWGDGDWEHSSTTWRAEELMAAVRAAQPGILVNDRWSLPGDYATPENRIPDGVLPARPWETCMTMNGTWGHVVHDHRWKPATELIRNLVDIVSKDGNDLLNVGPMGDGSFDAPTQERLTALGAWMRTNGEAIRGCGPVACARPAWGRLTASADRHRVHAIVFELPTDRTITIDGIAGVPARARVLGAPGIAVSTRANGPSLSITIGEGALDPAASVIVLEWDGEPAIVGTPELIGGEDLFLHETELAFKLPAAGEIHVTLDATAPTIDSPRYTVPINVQRTTQVRARTFVDGVAAGAPFEAILRRAEWIPGSDDVPPEPGVSWSIMPGRFERVPPEPWRGPGITRGTADTIALPAARPADAFALRIDGFILCDHAGIHAFTLESDDGSTLEIDGHRVVDHDGLHGPTRMTGKAALDLGWHRFTIRYIEADGGESLKLLWTTPADAPGTEPRAIDATLLRHEPVR
ncbi:MAG: alpha-L-fucosidase [Planctomycetes bacterium]|nr:alpha-L-fucosidase [Planctomycetota bacterium]